jgi:phosphoribosylformylglycinamidine synthase
MHTVLKVETHNHPTGIAPHPGASTGAGGEIRDEGATGRGAIPRFAMTGFSVSQLRIPDYIQPWEESAGQSDRLASALQIMLEGPVGAASFNNEFGRPNLLGYFRSFEQPDEAGRRGYRKPVMIAGGVGSIHADQVHKASLREGDLLVHLGGPGFRIGMGGGAASSVGLGRNTAALDFDSVQRANPEMQRRVQQVIESCAALGYANPILSIHDVGAGGLSNAFPELVYSAGLGAEVRLDSIPLEDTGMSPAEIWCNESQERYALAVRGADLARLEAICARERCPCAVIGTLAMGGRLRVVGAGAEAVIDMPLDQLLGNTPRLQRNAVRRVRKAPAFDSTAVGLDEACRRVLRHPTVASKCYLVTIADRTVGGLSHRDPMVGPWQVPVADHAIGLRDHSGFAGDALAVGERAPLALLDAAASVRMAIGEAVCNLLGSGLREVSRAKLSANWMAASGRADDEADLHDGVRAASALAVELGIAIPVGKDSLSMRATLEQGPNGEPNCEVRAPMTLIASAWAPVDDVRLAVTPQLKVEPENSAPAVLILVDLGGGRQRMGGSILTQCFKLPGGQVPDLDDPSMLRALTRACGELLEQRLVLACHDRSDGGLWATVCEMCFAGRCGVSLNIDLLTIDPQLADWGDFKIRPEQVAVQRHERALHALFSEELGLVIQVRAQDRDRVLATLRHHGLSQHSHVIGRLNRNDRVQVYRDAKVIFDEERAVLQAIWSEVSWRMAALRDDPDCAREEYEVLTRPMAHLAVDNMSMATAGDASAIPRPVTAEDSSPNAATRSTPPRVRAKPRVVVLREQGVNSQREMAAAFLRAGFDALDVTMSDLIEGRFSLLDPRQRIVGLAACGGFSFGDVLGAGTGWARTILLNPRLREQFEGFFAREDCFVLGVCNGCQMMAQLKPIVPGAAHWPRFLPNRSQQFEGRLSLVRIETAASPWLSGLEGLVLPVVVSHGEGRASFDSSADLAAASVVMRYALADASVARHYPENPNGSTDGVAALTAGNGRILITMPHPERSFLARQLSWSPPAWTDTTPWLELFVNMERFARE